MSSRSDKPQGKTSPSTENNFTRALGRIAENLFALEVTTIVQDRIPATKMPRPAEALKELARMYEEKLTAMRPAPPSQPPAAEKKGGMPAFGSMMERARTTLNQMHPAGETPPAAREAMAPGTAKSADAAIVERILRNSEELMNLTKKMGSTAAATPESSTGAEEMELTPDERMRLNVIWHMGVEQIAMQTIIHVSGDVVTRVRPEYVGEQGRGLVEIHHYAIRTSVEFWKTLVDVLGSMVGSLAQFFSGPKP
jgi:hypothetical protein